MRRTFPLTQISIRGATFCMPHRFPEIDKGAMLCDAVIRLGQLELRGNLAVLHTTRQSDSEYRCGVLFCPSSDSDRNRLVSLISRLESR